jgi:hypothetical protein
MEVCFDYSMDSYRKFMQVKSLPTYKIRGTSVIFPDEYSHLLGMNQANASQADYQPIDGLFDYQRDIVSMAVRKKKYAVFADCGLGKTLILLEFARHCHNVMPGKKVLIVSPLMVVSQTVDECGKFYGGEMRIEKIKSSDLGEWLQSSCGGIGITNYEALKEEVAQGNLGALILDESSMLKSHYGKFGTKCIAMGKGLEYKLALSGTPAPNDRIEYANHSVFLDVHKTTNEFLACYFVNRGQTQERWAIKPHALSRFYRDISHWCIFLTNPAVYGWEDNIETVPPINIHIDDVPMTPEQTEAVQSLTGQLFSSKAGGIASRSKLGQIAKGKGGIPTNKPGYIKELVDSWPDESTLIWCLYNDEQEIMERTFPDAESIKGETSYTDRITSIERFKSGESKVLISKPKILGFGLNLQVCTRQVFSGLQDSYESFYQAVKRSNRIGSTRPLNVHIPVTDVEVPMVQNVMEKAKRIQEDTETQEDMFRRQSIGI